MSGGGTKETIQSVVAKLSAPLTLEESNLVTTYHPSSVGYPTRELNDDERHCYDVTSFAKASDESSQFYHQSDSVSYEAFMSVAKSDVFVNADALNFLQHYMLYLFPKEFSDGVHLVNPLATSRWNNSKTNNFLKKGGKGFNHRWGEREYNLFFVKGNIFSAFKRVHFPFHHSGNHYMGANVDINGVPAGLSGMYVVCVLQ